VEGARRPDSRNNPRGAGAGVHGELPVTEADADGVPSSLATDVVAWVASGA